MTFRLVAFLAVAVCLVPAFGGNREDAVFLNQLLRRNLFRVARTYCETQQDRAINADESAAWSRKLANVVNEQSWTLNDSGRNEMLNEQIGQLESTLSDSSLSLPSRLRVRFSQIRLIVTGLEIRLVLNRAGHLSTRQNGVRELLLKQGNSAEERLSETDPAVDVLEKLLNDIRKYKSEFADDFSELRDEASLLKAELHAARARLVRLFDDSASNETAKAISLADSVLRSTRLPSHKRRAYELKAICLAETDSLSELDLHLRRLNSMFPESTRQLHHFLAVESKLKRQDADGAIEELSRFEPTTSHNRQKAAWLRTEAALIRYETASELRDQKLMKTAHREFNATFEESRQLTLGVFRSVLRGIYRRFELIQSVGVDVADLIEQVEEYRNIGKSSEALNLIDVALRRLPHDARRPRAALNLTAGELLLEQSKFKEAIDRLESAGIDFRKTEDEPREAAADLLRIYAIAQQLKSNSSGELRHRYETSLRDHLKNFPQQPSSGKARRWLIAILGERAPLDAFKLLNQQLEFETDVAERLRTAERMAELMRSLRESALAPEAREIFFELTTELVSNPAVKPRDAALLQFYLLEIEASSDSPSWPNIAATLEKISVSLLSRIQQERDSVELQMRSMGLQAVAAARTNQPAGDRLKLGHKVLALPDTGYSILLETIERHIVRDDLQTGDQWLAEIVDALLRRQTMQASTAQELIGLLRRATSNVTVTGQAGVQNDILHKLGERNLTSEQLQSVALLLSDSELPEASSSFLTAFWQRVLRNNSEGSELWLEATLQLSSLAYSSGDVKTAKKRLSVADTLYPKWGSNSRRHRAAELMQQLQ